MKQKDTKEKRVGKSYKIKPSVYLKCQKKAAKEKTTIANKIEEMLFDWSAE